MRPANVITLNRQHHGQGVTARSKGSKGRSGSKKSLCPTALHPGLPCSQAHVRVPTKLMERPAETMGFAISFHGGSWCRWQKTKPILAGHIGLVAGLLSTTDSHPYVALGRCCRNLSGQTRVNRPLPRIVMPQRSTVLLARVLL
jgi:hypothetical protein